MSQEKIIKALGLNPTMEQRLRQRMQEDRSHLSEVMHAAVYVYLECRDCGDFTQHKH